MNIKLANNAEMTVIKVDGGKQYIQGAQRDVLSFHFAKDGIAFDALDAAFGATANTERIIITTDDGAESLYEGYVLRQSLASKPVLITPETATSPAVYEERFVCEMAQETYTERLIRQLTAAK